MSKLSKHPVTLIPVTCFIIGLSLLLPYIVLAANATTITDAGQPKIHHCSPFYKLEMTKDVPIPCKLD